MKIPGRSVPLLGALIATAVIGAGVGTIVAVTNGGTTTIVSTPAVYLKPAGTGSACTQTAPCGDLAVALSAAGDGGTVDLESGQYPDFIVNPTPKLTAYKTGVTVQPQPGASPIMAGVRSYVPHITLTHLDGTGVVYFATGADFDKLLDSHLHGVGTSVLVRSSHTVIQDNLIEGGQTHDGINIAATHTPNTDTTVNGNTIRDFNSGPAGQEHADCIQLFDTDKAVITDNTMYDCYNSGITFSPGSNLGITNVVVQSNFIQGCVAARMQSVFSRPCGSGGSSVDVRGAWIKSATLDHNTIITGSARMPSQAGIVAQSNIIGFLSLTACSTSVTTSMILAYTTTACSGNPVGSTLPGTGNVVGTAQFVGQATGDLHLSADLVKPPVPASVGYQDIDGQAYTSGVGADQFGAIVVPSPSPSSSCVPTASPSG